MQKQGDRLRTETTLLLSNEPIGASLEAADLWRNLKPLSAQIFDDFAAKAGDDA